MAPTTTRKKVRLSVEDGPDIKSSPITVRVGEKPEIFFVHETPLCSNSMFFTRALKKEWEEGETRQVHLPEINPDTFEIWVKWVYTGRLCYSPTERDDSVDWLDAEWQQWSEIYALGDFLQDLDLKDAAIDAYIESMLDTNQFNANFAEWIYPYSKKGSLHRELAVDIFTEVWNRKDVVEISDQPAEFYGDVVVKLGPFLSDGIRTKSVKEFFRGADRCKYHDHGSERPCYKTRATSTL